MKNLNELITVILAETKEQEDKRQEYLNLINGIINGTTKEYIDIDTIFTKRINFHWYSDKMGGECISFSSDIVKRNDGELTKYNRECLEKSNIDIDKAINYMFDCGETVIDAFITHLSKVTIPQFLQNRYPNNYEISRNKFAAMYRVS